MNELDEIVGDFLIESRENLDQLNRDFLGLEQDPSASDLLANIFRTIHTIKATSGFLAFSKLEAITNAAEDLLSRLRDGKLSLTTEITSTLLAAVDCVRAILSSIESTGREGNGDYLELIERMNHVLAGTGFSAVPAERTLMVHPPELAATDGTAEDDVGKPIGQLLVEYAGVKPAAVDNARELQRQGDLRTMGEILVAHGAVSPSQAREVVEYQQETRAASAGDRSIRVDIASLDRMMSLVGELASSCGPLIGVSSLKDDPDRLKALQSLNRIAIEIQAAAMKILRQPIGEVWSRLPRVVRDLALAGGKQVRLKMDGEEIELDRTVIQAIKDPLTHVIRNSVDHGIESPQQRVTAGKPPEGCLSLRAFQEDGHVSIEISDDGAGVDLERVKRKALSKGLIDRDQSVHMSESKIVSLLFVPGFSTAERVTNISGRGVGLDVVKTNVEKVGGTVHLETRAGAGTTIHISIPNRHFCEVCASSGHKGK